MYDILQIGAFISTLKQVLEDGASVKLRLAVNGNIKSRSLKGLKAAKAAMRQ